MARGLAEDLAKSVGGTFIVINKEGRNNTLAATQVARSNADGYTLGFNAAGPFVSDLHTREGIPFKVEQIDFLCQLVELPVAFAVAANSKYKSLPELLRAAKSAPQTINVGSVGAGSVPTLVLGLLERQAGVKFNNIHYKGDGELVTALLGGHIDAAVPGVSTVAGKGLPVLATSSEHRVPNLQDVPTLKELGYPIVKVGMAGLYAPAGMPPEVRSRLVKACSEIASNGEKFKVVAARLKQQISFLGPDRWKQRITEDSEENKPIIKQLESAH
ncbi:MAG: hypothetical protein BGP08_09320 [Rhizobiales bacterium 64-17]|nr:MAG: hypothetical protein BGP08_09320 [Rhizobiales bacterium 64-17]